MSEQPVRIQRRRTKGWRKPENAVYVGRGSRWGNPASLVHADHGLVVTWTGGGTVGTWPSEAEARRYATEMYRHHLDANPALVERARRELAGRNLMCWCPLPEPGQPDHCHAAVLLSLVAAEEAQR